ncbi:MAG: CDP-alcohol phosphatidyltransferase family protein [Bacteroidetes bacterium]|nr:CDP-alcohol phosphatidyltransferase family protein [Bacteroidota bacterium]
MVKQIPNIITSLNLLCGCVAVLFAVSGDLVAAAVFVFLGIFFDFFDGLAARLLKAQSEVGLQFDSLADSITSGLAPGIVMVQLLSKSLTGEYFAITQVFSSNGANNSIYLLLPLIGLLIVIASGYRLAKFNVDTRQTDSFIGLPTPANALLILSFALILELQPANWSDAIILNTWFLVGVTLLSCILLNAGIRLFALKFRTWDMRTNARRYIFLVFCLVSSVLLKFLAIPLIITVYILMSLVWRERSKA